MEEKENSSEQHKHQEESAFLLAGDTLHSANDDIYLMLGSAVKHLDSGFGVQPSLTFRVLLLGTVFSCALGFVNMYYWFRSNPITLGIPVAQLLSLPAGWILSQALPKRKFNTFGMHWSMNPGPFSMKEHVLISVFANASTGTAYALDIIVARRFWIAPPLSFGAGVLVALASQLAGYSFSGLFHCFLVDPEAMVWPSTLVSVMLFRTLQSMLPQKTCQMFSPPSADVRALQSSRLRLFLIAFAASFAWYFVPGWIFPTLTMLPILCFIAPKSIYANQLGDGYNGLGMLALTLDWSTISNAYTGSPLATPWFAACNLSVGFVLVMWVITPIGYYANVWDAQSLPIYTNQLYDVDGNEYNVSRVLADGRLNTAAYEAYGPMHMSFQFLIMYGFCFMGITCLLTHVALYHGQDIWQTIQKIYSGTRAKFSNRVLNYSSVTGAEATAGSAQPPTHVPIYWYIVLFIATMAMGLASCQIFELLPWYGFLLAICLAGVLTLPVGLVEAVSNFQYALGVVTELIAGYLWPGEPTYNASFKMFGYVTMKQALMLTKDQKLGHYMKVPPRHLFICQILGTIIAVFVQLGTAFWLMNSVENICTDDGFPFTCRQGRLFYSTMVIWGVFGPQRQFSSRYSVLYWLFLVGIFLPLPFWVLKRKYPQSVWHYVNIPVALTYIGYMPNAPTHDFVMFTLFCFLFNYVLLKYKSVWWQKYNFTLTAALDTGLAISGIVSYFALQNNVHVSWWGTRNHCPLSKDPFVKHHNRIP